MLTWTDRRTYALVVRAWVFVDWVSVVRYHRRHRRRVARAAGAVAGPAKKGLIYVKATHRNRVEATHRNCYNAYRPFETNRAGMRARVESQDVEVVPAPGVLAHRSIRPKYRRVRLRKVILRNARGLGGHLVRQPRKRRMGAGYPRKGGGP